MHLSRRTENALFETFSTLITIIWFVLVMVSGFFVFTTTTAGIQHLFNMDEDFLTAKFFMFEGISITVFLLMIFLAAYALGDENDEK